MSSYSTLILSVSYQDIERVQLLNEKLSTAWDAYRFRVVDGPHLIGDLFVARANYLKADALQASLEAIEWEYPEELQVLVKHDDEDQYVNLRDWGDS